QTLQGTTDSQGTVVQHVPLGTQTGKLILDKLFHRRQTGTGNLIVDQWHIDLQLKDDLDAAGDIAGTKARLNNLGLFAGTQIDNNLDAQTRRALERFQTLYGIQVTGTLDENTKQKLKEKHGS
ncbi:MAG: peptidoglycan-binding domain-containing protein, partial [Anaerolineae bacterium]